MRRRKIKSQDPFLRKDHFVLSPGITIVQGEVIKITGEHGRRFRFLNHVTNPANGVQWIDCFEMQKGTGGVYIACAWRSFYPERVKHIPVRKKRNGTTARRATSKAS
jgi:hypothetical protein